MLIIRHATAIYPDPLDTSRAISFTDSFQVRHSHYLASMRQKRNLSLVNKFWHLIAQEFLYEFVWISRAQDAQLLAQALSAQTVRNMGSHIRRLHIQTSTMDRCNPTHLRTILDCSPNLIVYSDYRSVRRNILEESCNPGSSPEDLFKALAHPKNSLRRLSWTSYDDVSFHLRMTPMIEATAANLEFLELNFCSSHLHSMFSTAATASSTLTPIPTTSIALNLPALRTLKVTLDNATFSVLSAWTLPVLENLSVLSADFSYAGPGFSEFFIVHGSKLNQLELGHSSSMIEEHMLTAPLHAHGQGQGQIPLATWCPNLTEFICSADAEWNWENPDWIAPHVLLPSHPNVKFIGIRDICKRLKDDIAFARGNSPSFQENLEDDSPFFSLLQQMHSLLRSAAFPALTFIRDLSPQSDDMRRHRPQIRILKFWKRVLNMCRERDRTVWLEDCTGMNVTQNDLLRFAKRRFEDHHQL